MALIFDQNIWTGGGKSGFPPSLELLSFLKSQFKVGIIGDQKWTSTLMLQGAPVF